MADKDEKMTQLENAIEAHRELMEQIAALVSKGAAYSDADARQEMWLTQRANQMGEIIGRLMDEKEP